MKDQVKKQEMKQLLIHDIPADLKMRLKVVCVRLEKTITEVMVDMLEEHVEEMEKQLDA